MSIFSGKSNLFLAISSFGTVASIVLGYGSASASPFTIGDDLIDRNTNDVWTGMVLVAPDSFGSTTQELSSWSMFDNDFSGRQITPLILEDVGNDNYNITGIGTTRTSDASGIQSFSFDLVSGSADVGGDLYFGWKDGSNGSNNEGVIDFDFNTSDSMLVVGRDETNISVGQTLDGRASKLEGFYDMERSYSIQATAVPFETSPTSGIFILGGIFGISRLKKNLAAKKTIQNS